MLNKLTNKFFNWQYFLPTVLFVFALICISNLNTAALWRDEAFSALTAKLPVSEILQTSAADTQPPLYFLLLKSSGLIFGYSEIVLRSWSVLAMIIVLYLTYKLAKDYFKKQELASWALLLMAFNPVTFVYALEARAYAWLIAVVLASATFALKYTTTHNPKWLIPLTVSLLCGMYLHNVFMVPLVVISGLVFLDSLTQHKYHNLKTYFQRNSLLFLPPIFLLVGYLPWLTFLLAQVSTINNQGFWYNFNPYLDFFRVIIALFTTEQFNIRTAGLLNINFVLLAVMGLTSIFYGWFKELKNWRQKLPIFTILSLAPMLLVYAVSFYVPLMYYRYLVFILPFFILLTVLAWNKRPDILRFILIVMLINSIYYLAILPYQKENYPKLLAGINYRSGYDAILTNNALPIHGLKYYTGLPVAIDASPESTRNYEGKAILSNSDYTQVNKTSLERIWVPYTMDLDGGSINKYKSTLTAQGFHEAYTIRVSNELYLSLFDRRVIVGQN